MTQPKRVEPTPAKPTKTAARKPAPTVQRVAPAARSLAVVEAAPKNLLVSVMTAITNPDVDPAKMQALLDVRARLMRELAEVGYRLAYREARRRMPRIDKDGKLDEGTTRSGRAGKKARFATYENINTVIAPILDEAGLDLSLHAEPKPDGEGILMRATLSYIADTEYGKTVYSESSVVPMPPEPGQKNAAQAISSALAYAKRNAVVLVLNIVSHAPEDRDRDGHDPKVVDKNEGPATISTEQITALGKAIIDCGVGLERFCAKYKIETVSELPASSFDAAMSACKNYKPKAGDGKASE